MMNLKLIEKLFILLFLGFSLCAVQACDDDDDDKFENVNNNNDEAVDLGLSVKWATCNIGASSPEEIGDYFAWGETEPKKDYSWETYKWSKGTDHTMTKYCTDSYYGTVDNKAMLDSSDDVATVRCGSNWRMPSQMEWRELYEQCTWSRIKNGYKVVGPNGKSIFLPLGGTYEGTILEEYDEDGNLHGQYWAYSLGYEDGDEDFDNNDASRFFMANEMSDCYFGDADRCCGLNVRAVQEKGGIVQNHKYVDLGLSVKWATCNVGASKPEDYGDYYAWGETTTKSDYDWDTYKWCKGTYRSMTKYCTDSDDGTVDNRTRLISSDDVATVKWGSKWRMPTLEEMNELRGEDCTWTWTTQNGVKGMKLTGPNGNSIFLPAAGNRYGTGLYDRGSSGYYWSATLDEDGNCAVYYLDFYSGGNIWDNV